MTSGSRAVRGLLVPGLALLALSLLARLASTASGDLAAVVVTGWVWLVALALGVLLTAAGAVLRVLAPEPAQREEPSQDWYA